jgi:DNA-binding NtrC family response regulator
VVEPSCIILSAEVRGDVRGDLRGDSVPRAFFSIDLPSQGGPPGQAQPQPPSLAEVERAYIARLLEFTEGNRTQVARILGVSYPTVAKKITDYGL